MKATHRTARLVLAFFILWTVSAFAHEKQKTGTADVPLARATTIQLKTPKGIVSIQLPLTSSEYAELPVAEVNGDPVLLEELAGALMATYTGEGEDQHAEHQDLHTILKRIINLRLLEQEARNIGFDETPEFAKEEASFKEQLLRTMLRSQQIQAVQPDEKEVAKLAKQMSTSVELDSVMFVKKEDAKKALAAIKGGASYEEVVKKALQKKTAQGNLLGARSYSLDQLLPGVLTFVTRAKAGELSPVIATGDGFALIKVEEAIKTVDDPQIKEQARQKLLAKETLKVVRAYFDQLKKKYAVIHQDIIDSLDYSAEKPGLAALLKDKRVIIEIKGEQPITVASFSEELAGNLYHGSESKENRARLNTMKNTQEENLLFKKLFLREAMQLGLDKTKQFEKGVQEFERKTLFNAFVNKVIVPAAKVNEETVRKYYNEHLADYTSPKMLRMKALIFDNEKSAKSALALLQQGTDFKWLSANADHQVSRDTKGLLQFDSNVLSLSALPADAQEVIGGAKDGDYRLYKGADSHFYVLAIDKVFPAKPTPYEEVRQSIAKELFKERIPQQVEEWAVKLAKNYEVKTYLVDAKK